MTDPMKFTGPADILAFIPHTLGYQPDESFVLLTMQGAKLGATLRLDAPEEVSPADYAQATVSYLAADDDATAALLVVYSDETGDAGQRPYGAHIEALIRELDIASMPLRDGWLVTSSHWRNLLCEDGCCPNESLDAVTDSVANAALIYAGSSADTFAAPAPFTGAPDTAEAIAAATPGGHPDDMDLARAVWAQVLDHPDTLSPFTARQLAGAFQHKLIRDFLMADVITTAPERFTDAVLGEITERPDWARVDRAQALAFELMKSTPEGQRAPMLCLIGWLEWLKGKATFAARYFKLATDDVEDFRLAVLLTELVNRGLIAPVARNKETSYAATRQR